MENPVTMRSKVLVAVALILSAFGNLVAGTTPVAAGNSVDLIDVESDCSSTATMVPFDVETPLVGDWETQVVLDAHILLVGVDLVDAQRIMSKVATLYDTVAVRLNATFETVDLKIESDTSGAVLSTSESQAYIDASREYFGGKRPWFADVVYTMVGDELASSVAGQADCVGGIAYSDASFAVGEVRVGAENREHGSAKIAAHEIAHLLGAHHHFMNCAEGNKEDLVSYLAVCTLMANEASLVSLGFSSLEASVFRWYALEYATKTPSSPPPAEPEPEPSTDPDPQPSHDPDPEPDPEPEQEGPRGVERSITLAIRGNRVAKGNIAVAAEDDRTCTELVPVTIERRKRNGEWTMIAENLSREDSTFRVALDRKGTYRVIAPEVEFEDRTCLAAQSATVRTD